MPQPTRAGTKNKAEQEAQQKALRRAEQANILAGVRPILEPEEQLLAFARARIAGGWRGKLNVGPEAFFAPYANAALTERRFIVQHVHHSSGRPSEMLPHSYALGAIARATFTDIETFGGEPACRLILHLQNGLYVRLRLRGQLNFAAAKNMVELFDSLTLAQRATTVSPLQKTCAHCSQILDNDYKFCPYCGTAQASASGITLATGEEEEARRQGEEENASPPAPAFVPQETDFAYERADRPAEFGIALPLPEQAQSEPESEAVTAEDVTPVETGITVSPTANMEDTPPDAPEVMLDAVAPENFSDVSSFTSQGDNTLGEPQEAVNETAEITQTSPALTEVSQQDGMRQTLEPDDLTTFDYPLAADFDTTEPMPTTATAAETGANAEFGQYDAQDYAELPFSQTPDVEIGDGQAQELNVADDSSDVVRDDINEAFAPSHPMDSATDPNEHAPGHHDSFADDTPHATGDDNVDFNVPTTENREQEAPTPDAQHPTPNTENQP